MANQEGVPEGPDLRTGVSFDELGDGVPLLGHVDGEAVILVRDGDEVFALGAHCSHYGGPLVEGLVVDGCVRCPLHHARFDLRDGSPMAPGLDAISCYEVTRYGKGMVRVDGTKPPTPPDRAETDVSRVVIVGAGAAGAACAEALRNLGFSGTITLVAGDEPWPVDRPNLSKDYLAGDARDDWLPVRTPNFYPSIDVEFLPALVESVDPRRRSVAISSDSPRTYDALVLATGAWARRLPIDGVDRDEVHTLHSLRDAKTLAAAAEKAESAVVIGASFIGLEVAASLRKRGLDVSVVAPERVPLERTMGAELGRFVQGVHESEGVAFRLGRKPSRIDDDGVHLDDDSVIPADLVVLGVGVEPRVELARRAGLEISNGVVVDESFRTSDPAIYAVGDIASFPLGESRARIEHWVVAQRQGQAVARAIVGQDPIPTVPFFWSLHFDVAIRYVGHCTDPDSIEVFGSLDERDAIVAFRKDGRVEAVATVGRDLDSLNAEYAMERGDQEALQALLEE